MSIAYVDDDDMTAIANALRSKLGTEITYKPSQMAVALQALDVVKNDLASLLDRTLTSYDDLDGDVTSVKTYGFGYCLSIFLIRLPACVTLHDHAMFGCKRLKTLEIPVCTTIGDSAMSGCERLTDLDLPVCTSIGTYAFNGCSRLASITLRSSTMCVVADDTFLHNSLIAEGNGKIYVPSALVDTYKAATGWSTYASQIEAIAE